MGLLVAIPPPEALRTPQPPNANAAGARSTRRYSVAAPPLRALPMVGGRAAAAPRTPLFLPPPSTLCVRPAGGPSWHTPPPTQGPLLWNPLQLRGWRPQRAVGSGPPRTAGRWTANANGRGHRAPRAATPRAGDKAAAGRPPPSPLPRGDRRHGWASDGGAGRRGPPLPVAGDDNGRLALRKGPSLVPPPAAAVGPPTHGGRPRSAAAPKRCPAPAWTVAVSRRDAHATTSAADAAVRSPTLTPTPPQRGGQQAPSCHHHHHRHPRRSPAGTEARGARGGRPDPAAPHGTTVPRATRHGSGSVCGRGSGGDSASSVLIRTMRRRRRHLHPWTLPPCRRSRGAVCSATTHRPRRPRRPAGTGRHGGAWPVPLPTAGGCHADVRRQWCRARRPRPRQWRGQRPQEAAAIGSRCQDWDGRRETAPLCSEKRSIAHANSMATLPPCRGPAASPGSSWARQ